MPYLKSGQEFLVNTQTTGSQLNPDILTLPNGKFLVDWYDAVEHNHPAPRVQLYTADGIPSGTESAINAAPSAVLNDGRLISIFTDNSRILGGVDKLAHPQPD